MSGSEVMIVSTRQTFPTSVFLLSRTVPPWTMLSNSCRMSSVLIWTMRQSRGSTNVLETSSASWDLPENKSFLWRVSLYYVNKPYCSLTSNTCDIDLFKAFNEFEKSL